MKTFILLLSFVVISSNFTNPVVDVDAPDPGIFFFENFYYIVNTGTDGKGGYYPIRKSQDLVHWELIGTVFNETTKPSYAIDSVYIFSFIFFPFSSGHLNSIQLMEASMSTSLLNTLTTPSS